MERTRSGGCYFPMGRDAAAALSLYVFVSPAAVRLGHGPYPRQCLAVLLSPDTVQHACLRCGRHLRVGHDLMERSPGHTAVQSLQLPFFCWRSAVVHPYLSATGNKPALRRRVQYTVQ